ncbi:MAG TPA: phosphotransferase [Thermoplasmata archaeon]
MKTRTDIPDDPALPALGAIRSAGLAAALPEMGLDGGPVELRLCGYTPGARATIEARAGDRHFAVKAYAKNPVREGALYEALGAAGSAPGSRIRVPPLLARNRKLRLLVIGWLEGPSVPRLIRDGRGERAGYVAARWFRQAASLDLRFGPRRGAAHALRMANRGFAVLGAADSGLGTIARALSRKLVRTRPRDGPPRLVHGTLYDRHVLDLGDCTGVIDWQRFGRGPLEMDAGMFLATTARIALMHGHLAGEVAQAEEAFRRGTAGVLDERALVWHQAAAFLRLASKPVSRAGGERLRARGELDPRAAAISRARTLLDEAALVAEPVFRDLERVPGRIRTRFPTLEARPQARFETFKDEAEPSTERIK